MTREDIDRDLEAAAARKKRIDEERAAKAGAEVAHVSCIELLPADFSGYWQGAKYIPGTYIFYASQVREVVEKK